MMQRRSTILSNGIAHMTLPFAMELRVLEKDRSMIASLPLVYV